MHESGSSPSSNKKELPQAVERNGFLKAERGWKKEIISKECIVSGKVTFLRRMEEPGSWVSSLVLTG